MSKFSELQRKSKSSPRVEKKFRPGLERLEDRLVLSGDAVLRWNNIALDAVKNDFSKIYSGTPEQGGPTGTARALAIVQAAVYDAVNDIERSYASYLVDAVAPPDSSIDAAVATAA